MAQHGSGAVRRNLLKRFRGISVSVAADNKLRHEGRVGKAKGQYQVDDEKGCAPIAGRLRRESPDIPKPYSTACRRHDKADTRVELSARCSHGVLLV